MNVEEHINDQINKLSKQELKKLVLYLKGYYDIPQYKLLVHIYNSGVI